MKDISIHKSALEEEKVRLEAQLSTVGRRNPANPADWEALPSETTQEADLNDVATSIEGYEDNAGILKELETRYNEVLAALDRIEKGTYGVCKVGDEEIEEDRLAADPAATTCKAHLG